MSIRESYVQFFGEQEAENLETAALAHGNGINDLNQGSDVFRWAVCVCIGYECFTRDKFRAYHNIRAPAEDIKRWIKEHARLGEHDGDIDYLAMLTGTYDEYVERKDANNL